MTEIAVSPEDERAAAGGRTLVLLTVSLCTMLYSLTVTIVNVTLPQLQGALSATPDQVAWVVTLNLVATAVVTPMTGWLVGRFGRRPVMIWAVAGFALSSLLCATATTLAPLLLYRIGQGAFGAPLVPLSQALIVATYPGPPLNWERISVALANEGYVVLGTGPSPQRLFDIPGMGRDLIKAVAYLHDGQLTGRADIGRECWLAGSYGSLIVFRALLEDPDIVTEEGVNTELLQERVNAAFEQFTVDELNERLEANQVPFAKINARPDVVNDPQVQAVNSLWEFDHPFAGPMRQARPPGRFSETPAEIFRCSPELGEHTREVLSQFGFTDEAVAEWTQRRLGHRASTRSKLALRSGPRSRTSTSSRVSSERPSSETLTRRAPGAAARIRARSSSR